MTHSPTFSDLRGKRLGAAERSILLNAGCPGSIATLILRTPSGRKTEQESLRRAAWRLRNLGLIRITRMREGRRVHDPRVHQPVYRDGQFYVRQDKTRKHYVGVLVCWHTEFGEALTNAYRTELQERKPIRWSMEKYECADRLASMTKIDAITWKTAEDEISLLLEQTPSAIEGEEPYIPPGCGPKELGRWDLSVQVAAARFPRAGSGRVLDEALEIMNSDQSTEEIAREAPEAPRRGPGKTAQLKGLPDYMTFMRERIVDEHYRNK